MKRGTPPLITCLCTTRNRPYWLKLAIEYFLSQTFKDAELLILADGVDIDGVSVPQIAHPQVRVKNLPHRPNSLGEKRNIGCKMGYGSVIAIWDDDDYNSPNRLEDQITIMKRSGLPATAYNRMKFTDGKNWWVYDGILQTTGIGGSLMFTKEFWERNQFPHLNEAEDNALIYAAWRRREYIASQACPARSNAGLEGTDLMYATIHAGNTSVRRALNDGNYAFLGLSDASDRVIGAFRATEAAYRG